MAAKVMCPIYPPENDRLGVHTKATTNHDTTTSMTTHTHLNPHATSFQANGSSSAFMSPSSFPFSSCESSSPSISMFHEAMQQHKHKRRNRACKLDFTEVTDVTSFMHVLRLHKYTASLVRAHVDLHTLLHLQDDDLARAGIMAQGARTRLLVAVEKFKRTLGEDACWLIPPASMGIIDTSRGMIKVCCYSYIGEDFE